MRRPPWANSFYTLLHLNVRPDVGQASSGADTTTEQAMVVEQRFLCACGKSFSQATHDPCYAQKKRQLNPRIFVALTSTTSQRRAALDLGVNRKTIVRKFIFVGLWAKTLIPLLNAQRPAVKVLEFDDLETSEHTKCKPISVTLAVESTSRWIVDYRVASMPAKGKLATFSRQKYGKRKDERPMAREELFEAIKPYIAAGAMIKSDKNPHYPAHVEKHFPDAEHKCFKGQRASSDGQGELRKKGFDPLFSINHTFAMLRANMSRLIRRTWCTTKLQDRLDLHIAIYVLRHNLTLLEKPIKKKRKAH